MLKEKIRETIKDIKKDRQKKKIEKEKMKRRNRKFGQAPLKHSKRGFLMLVISAIGVYKAIQGFKERDKDYRSCKIGIVLNGIFTFVLIGIFLRGLI